MIEPVVGILEKEDERDYVVPKVSFRFAKVRRVDIKSILDMVKKKQENERASMTLTCDLMAHL